MARIRLRHVAVTFLAAGALFFNGMETGARTSDEVLSALQGNGKLSKAEDILNEFGKGNQDAGVIVILRPSAIAEELVRQSRPGAPAKPGAEEIFPRYDLRSQVIKEALQTTVRETVAGVIDQLDAPGMTVIRRFTYQFGFAARVTPEALLQIVENPQVAAVFKDRVLKPHLAQGIALIKGTAVRSSYDGSGVSIAIIDTGVDTSHPRLGGGGVFNSKVIGGFDFGDNDDDPRPDPVGGDAHGTACAGIAAGDTGTSGDYIGGVAPGARLYALKITQGTTSAALESALFAAWEWAVFHQNDDTANPILIISTSFGSNQSYGSACDMEGDMPNPLALAAEIVTSAGITIFASSGNDGLCGAIASPACISAVNSVGAVYDADFGGYEPCIAPTSCAPTLLPTGGCSTGFYATDNTGADTVPSYSNTASFLNLLAPANEAYTTDIVGAGGYNVGDYTNNFGGTSASAPYAAGAAAVLQNAARKIKGRFLTPAEVRRYLVNGGDAVTDGKTPIIKPRVNLARAISAMNFSWSIFMPAFTQENAR